MGGATCDLLDIAGYQHTRIVQLLFDPRERTYPSRRFNETEWVFEEKGDEYIHPEFRMFVVTELQEERLGTFFEYGPFPLEHCHLLIVNEV